MAQTYKILGQALLVATTGNYVYTVPDSKGAVISTILVTNTSGATITYDLNIVKADDGAATASNLVYPAKSVAAGATDSIKEGISLSNLDQIYVETPDSGVVVTVMGVEFAQENVYAP